MKAAVVADQWEQSMNASKVEQTMGRALAMMGLGGVLALVSAGCLASPSIGDEFKVAYPDPVLSDSVFFGVSASLSGDTAVAGAMGAQVGGVASGAALVYVRDGTSWIRQATLSDASAAANAYFGHTVAIDGDTVAVGAPGGPTTFGPGSVYVYVRSNGLWSLQQHILATDGSNLDQFGYSVALSGDTLLVGAPSDSPGTPYGQGSAYVYTRTAGVWSQQAKFTETTPAVAHYFGSQVALHGDTAMVGASAANAYRGAVEVFVRNDGTWSRQTRLVAADGEAGDQFGGAIAVHGDTAAIGAFLDDIDGQQWKGSTHVFARNNGVWALQQQLLLDDSGSTPQFGLGVAIDEDDLLVGARVETVSLTFQGAAVHYRRDGATWVRQQKLVAGDAQSDAAFGHALALSGTNVMVGAYTTEPAGMPNTTNAGAAYFYQMAPPNLAPAIFADGFESLP